MSITFVLKGFKAPLRSHFPAVVRCQLFRFTPFHSFALIMPHPYTVLQPPSVDFWLQHWVAGQQLTLQNAILMNYILIRHPANERVAESLGLHDLINPLVPPTVGTMRWNRHVMPTVGGMTWWNSAGHVALMVHWILQCRHMMADHSICNSSVLRNNVNQNTNATNSTEICFEPKQHSFARLEGRRACSGSVAF